MKYIKLVIDNLNIKPNSEIKGYVTVNYPGAYDGVVINTLIMDSNKLIVYSYTPLNFRVRFYIQII